MAAEILYIVMPCYNESAGIETTAQVVSEKLRSLIDQGRIAANSAMLFADDGSRDNTWELLEKLHAGNPMVKASRLAGNRGKEYALFAGLMEAKDAADIVICMDADLQHDINAIDTFLDKREEGYELLYGLKTSRGKEPFIRKITAKFFYWFMGKLGSPVLRGHSDYSLMTKQVLEALSEYNESNMMFRAVLRQLGFNQAPVYFEVKERELGESKMSLRKLLALSLDAITSFSVAPLRIIAGIGLLIFIISLFMVGWVVYDYFRIGTPNGWATLTCSLWFIGGLGMICLSIVGEYIGKMYMETKKRPRYFIKTRLR